MIIMYPFQDEQNTNLKEVVNVVKTSIRTYLCY